MNSTIERLLSLRVRDVMRKEVIAVHATDTMKSAADLFDENEITGAPVVDGDGKCVGILSSSDFVYRELTSPRWEKIGDSRAIETADPATCETPDSNRVEDFMSPLVQTVSEELPILSAARVMCHEHIHRLLVVDDDHRPQGILSSLDLVACMVVAVEE